MVDWGGIITDFCESYLENRWVLAIKTLQLQLDGWSMHYLRFA